MDESTDVAGLAILMVIVSYLYLVSFHEDLLLCKPLSTITTGSEIFKLLDEFFEENSILLDNCVDVCTDGAKAMTGFGERLKSDIPADILNKFEVDLLPLIDTFDSYFPKRWHENVWVVEPYSISKKPSPLTSQEYEFLLDLTSDTAITSKFKTEKSTSDFWYKLKDEFKILSDKAKLILLPFSTTYLVETGFSSYTATKTNYKSRLNAEQDIQLQLSEVQPYNLIVRIKTTSSFSLNFCFTKPSKNL
ncbi:Zinc finger BED domain-containing protein 5 [Araneus ventricosus]|uniref:Zinc finger BED domain-containing protein 5 n=1 Tax=Araneus ventricosus TaxID=182803 RepID=A0A4Y2LK70_ARAVE|nr:Zinc finger BED domain-containing protein 5 [Araneus ventricosus]